MTAPARGALAAAAATAADTPRGRRLHRAGHGSHGIECRGSDLHRLARRLDPVQALGADVPYLKPVHLAGTRHKHDVFDHTSFRPNPAAANTCRRWRRTCTPAA